MSKTEVASRLRLRGWQGFLWVIAGFAVAIVLVNLVMSGIFTMTGPPTYLHAARCITDDGVELPARYDDLFHRWEVKAGHGLIGPRYVAASNLRCSRIDGETKARMSRLTRP